MNSVLRGEQRNNEKEEEKEEELNGNSSARVKGKYEGVS